VKPDLVGKLGEVTVIRLRDEHAEFDLTVGRFNYTLVLSVQQKRQECQKRDHAHSPETDYGSLTRAALELLRQPLYAQL